MINTVDIAIAQGRAELAPAEIAATVSKARQLVDDYDLPITGRLSGYRRWLETGRN